MKKTFSYEEAAALLPEVQRLTDIAVEEVEALASDAPRDAGTVQDTTARARRDSAAGSGSSTRSD